MKIGIVGGGIGGLAVAWNIHERTPRDQEPPDIVIFEKSDRFGGNADTKHFDFGNGPGYEDRDRPLLRWADLGVNDFNVPAYRNIVSVMDRIGYTKENGRYRSLENTTTYYDTRGRAFTDNSLPYSDGRKQDPWWGTAMRLKLARSVASFMEIASAHAEDRKFHEYTLEQYIAEQSPVHEWDEGLGPEVIYPRVNGMYFTSASDGPRKMPFAAVMHYYKIQEGAGGASADRNYFVGGVRTWVDALTGYMQKNMPEIEWHVGWDAEMTFDETSKRWRVARRAAKAADCTAIDVDILVLATPADAALRAVKSGLPAEVANIMAQIRYEVAVSVAHTDSRLLPVNRNAWSTYNIVIHQPGSVALKPYTIHYVANRHQNDADNPEFDKFGLPEFFVSINPHVPVSEDRVLKDRNDDPATANLSHFVFDFACMQAQTDIKCRQGLGNLYYASGWTHGSGLHTECWTQGSEVALSILEHVRSGEPAPCKPLERADLVTSRLTASAAGATC